MKKICIWLLSLSMALGTLFVVSCGRGNSNSSDDSQTSDNSSIFEDESGDLSTDDNSDSIPDDSGDGSDSIPDDSGDGSVEDDPINGGNWTGIHK